MSNKKKTPQPEAPAPISREVEGFTPGSEYPIQDDVWPSRRWNKERTEYIDLSGEEVKGFEGGEMKWQQWGETITISNFEGDVLKINPSGNYDAGIPSKEDRELAEAVTFSLNQYPTLYRENQQLKKELESWKEEHFEIVERAANTVKELQEGNQQQAKDIELLREALQGLHTACMMDSDIPTAWWAKHKETVATAYEALKQTEPKQ